MTSQADRERFAPMLGFRSLDGRSRYYDSLGRREINSSSHLPDFLDPKGEYFGPAVIKLLDAGWAPQGKMIVDADCVARYSWVRGLEIISDPNPVRATMLALEKQRAMEEGK